MHTIETVYLFWFSSVITLNSRPKVLCLLEELLGAFLHANAFIPFLVKGTKVQPLKHSVLLSHTKHF